MEETIKEQVNGKDIEEVDVNIKKIQPQDAKLIQEALKEKRKEKEQHLQEIAPKLFSEQVTETFTDKDYEDDLNTLYDVYSKYTPWKQYDSKFPEVNLKTNIKLLTEQMTRTNLAKFKFALSKSLVGGRAEFKNDYSKLKVIKETIEKNGLICFLDSYVEEYIKIMKEKFADDKEISTEVYIAIFISCYVTALVDCVLAKHFRESMSALSITKEIIDTQLEIVRIVANVRRKEFSAEDLTTLGLRWCIDFSDLGALKIPEKI